jgi:hypothetical protein
MPRFALVAHDHPFDHWDLFLEAGPVLRTWRLIPRLEENADVAAESTPDHRLSYLDYEGPISGDRGNVSRIDSGNFAWERDDAECLAIQIVGKVFVGRLVIASAQRQLSARFDPAS